MRLLDYLLEHELVPDERTGRGLAMRGDVLVDERPVTSPAAEVKPGQVVRLRGAVSGDISRGAGKLRPVLDRAGFDPRGHICLDLGVSTGGFTQVLLERGAARVYAVDVAYGVTALALRNDPRVVLLERTNARELTCAQVRELVERVVGDLSFIGWAAVLPAIVPLTAADAGFMLLVKPQFELAARGMEALLEHGVARDRQAVRQCLTLLYNVWVDNGLTPLALIAAALRGARGNQEYFAHLVRSSATRAGPAGAEHAYARLVDAALAEAQP